MNPDSVHTSRSSLVSLPLFFISMVLSYTAVWDGV